MSFSLELMPVVHKVKHFSRGGQHHLNSSFYSATKIGISARRKSFQLEKCFQLRGKQFCYTGFEYKIVPVQDVYQWHEIAAHTHVIGTIFYLGWEIYMNTIVISSACTYIVAKSNR
ncbi:unnamed protein product [Ixodes pacificus]